MNLLTLMLGGFITAALLIMWLTAVSNFAFFPRLKAKASAERPFISILIPARNEATVIAATVRAVLGQSYTHFELLLLDDHSSDDTAVVAQAAAQNDDRFRVINGRALPGGWLGKNWACHQLAQQAKGDLLLFIDADVRLDPDALNALIHLQTRSQADLLTVWPTQKTVTWGERLVVPLMALAILAYLPILPVHHTRLAAFAAANGQCLLFRRAAYERIGGHTAVRHDVVEDVALARLIKLHGQRLRMADGHSLVRCRMYHSWDDVRSGFAKNILAGHGHSPLFLFASTLFHWLVFVGPWLWLIAAPALWPLLLGLAGMGLRMATAVFTQQRPGDALLMPLSVLLMSRIAAQSIWWRWRGQAAWKGRLVS